MKLKFKTLRGEDSFEIVGHIDGSRVGHLYCEVLWDSYDVFFSDVFSENEFYKIFPDDTIIDFQTLKVDPFYRGSGFAGQLVAYGLKYFKKKGYKQFYLNASPMGTRGLDRNQLVNFYKKFGFKEILRQGGNTLMALVIK